MPILSHTRMHIHSILLSHRNRPSRPPRGLPFLVWLAATAAGLCVGGTAFAEPPQVEHPQNVGVRVPDGFDVTVFADDELAHDIFCMTIDSFGRVVVSGPGYVRILLDDDGDGTADRFQQFADGPKTGAQGMYFRGRDLLCLGDAGLIRYRDQNADDRADGPPDVFLHIKTGSEHHAHAVRRGPDGWWYLIAGNMAGVTGKYATLATSPIHSPEGGTLLRLKPDLSGGEIFADGFRNAYDFAFNAQGDVFTYDSDGERDVSLPWYRPTRVYHVMPGGNAGWVSRTWKKPNDFFEMPPVLAEFGRGSPTGVLCYRHTQFPAKYRNALFVLDWSFGRVLALPLKPDGSTWQSEPISFMTGIGQYGFAPTDIAVGPDGSLFVSVGGRGTRGRVFRVRSVQKGVSAPDAGNVKEASAALTAVLNAPQPLSSWSRARWTPKARELGSQPFRGAALDEQLEPAMRVRAIEVLTDLFDGLDADALQQLAGSKSPAVRARAVWSLGRTQTTAPDADLLLPFLKDEDPHVVRCALEALLGAGPPTRFDPLLPALAAQLAADDRYVRQRAALVVGRLPEESQQKLAAFAQQSGLQARVAFALGRLMRSPRLDSDALSLGIEVLESSASPEIKLQATRLMQLALGDVGPAERTDSSPPLPPAFDSYTSRLDLSQYERALDPVRVRLAPLYPIGRVTRPESAQGVVRDQPRPSPRSGRAIRSLDRELSRLLAMLTPYNSDLLDRVLGQISRESNPVDDVHQLIVASRIPVERTHQQRSAVVQALIQLDSKFAARNLNRDLHWDDRVGEVYGRLCTLDPELSAALLNQPEFGRPGDVLFLSQLDSRYLQTAVEAFARKIKSDPDYPWTTDVVFVLGASDKDEHRHMVRDRFDDFALRSAVLMVLSEHPVEDDREKFVQGLESSQREVLSACLKALTQLPPSDEAPAQFALLKTLRRLGRDQGEVALQERVVKLLRRNTGQTFGSVAEGDHTTGDRGHRPPSDAIKQWTAWLTERYPEEAARQFADAGGQLDRLNETLTHVDWDAGDADRGRTLFEKQSCSQCHGGRRALGPDLAGVTKRFSRKDVFTAIAVPNRDVSPRYQTTLIQTTDGKVYTGLVVYESVDGLILRNATNQTFRVEAEEIEQRRILNESLMPNGLLKDLTPQDLADLYAYLQHMGESANE